MAKNIETLTAWEIIALEQALADVIERRPDMIEKAGALALRAKLRRAVDIRLVYPVEAKPADYRIVGAYNVTARRSYVEVFAPGSTVAMAEFKSATEARRAIKRWSAADKSRRSPFATE